MRQRRGWWPLVSVACAAVVFALAFGLLWSRDVARLHGTWIGDGVSLTFHGDVVVIDWRESGRTEQLHFRLDATDSPARIVTFDADAPTVIQPVRLFNIAFSPPSAGSPDHECHGIYELRGDRLRICLPPPGESSPTHFDPAMGRIFELRRE